MHVFLPDVGRIDFGLWLEANGITLAGQFSRPWAKLAAMTEGARIASRRLFGAQFFLRSRPGEAAREPPGKSAERPMLASRGRGHCG
jgi:hypothetical protein